MKIIHAADLHIGSAFGDFSNEAKRQRKAELVNSFKRIVDYAHENSISIILLSGDVFDKDRVNKADKDYFYQIIEGNPDISFYYLKGNHDIKSEVNKEDIPNLFLFNNEWKYYNVKDVVIAGVEISSNNKSIIPSTLNLTSDKFNIVMLHSDIKELAINKFKNKFIDYMALGHIHSYSCNNLDSRGVYVYSGCLEGRGFDEVGEKGFVVIDSTAKTHQFIPFAVRGVYKVKIDITNTKTLYDAVKLIEEKMFFIPKGSIARSIVIGSVTYPLSELDKRLHLALDFKFMYYEVKNKTTKLLNLIDYQHDISLRGEVIRTILSKKLDLDKQNQILDDCMKLLNGEDIYLCD